MRSSQRRTTLTYYGELTRAGIGPHRTAELLLAGTQDADYHVDIGPYSRRGPTRFLCHTSQIEARSRRRHPEELVGVREAQPARAEAHRDTTTGVVSPHRISGDPPAPPGTPSPIPSREAFSAEFVRSIALLQGVVAAATGPGSR